MLSALAGSMRKLMFTHKNRGTSYCDVRSQMQRFLRIRGVFALTYYYCVLCFQMCLPSSPFSFFSPSSLFYLRCICDFSIVPCQYEKSGGKQYNTEICFNMLCALCTRRSSIRRFFIRHLFR